MALAEQLTVGLKEWASVCGALADGRQMLLLRKGGIYESAGEFEVEHRQFLLFPTYLHQKAEMLKAAERGRIQHAGSEPAEIELSAAAEVTDIVQLKDRSQMEALDGEHIWTGPLIDMRFDYRPENPLYLLLVRAYRLSSPVRIANTPAYAGCKSWVPLNESVAVSGVMAALDDEEYQKRRTGILQRL